MTCPTCQDRCEIYRKVRRTEKVVVDGDGLDRTVTSYMGGADACPECAARAESEFRVLMLDGMRRAAE